MTMCGWWDLELIEDFAASPRWRRRSAEERRLIVEEALEPGASVARVARKRGVNANQVFGWKRLYETGRLGAPAGGITLLPVRVAEELAIAKVEDFYVQGRRGWVWLQEKGG